MGSAAARVFGMRMLYVGVYKSSSQAQGRAVIRKHPNHAPMTSVHGSDRYMVYHECAQLIFDFRLSLKSSIFAASVYPFAGWESTQGSYHTD